MKRKLDENDVPATGGVRTSDSASAAKTNDVPHTFNDLGLDPRLLQAIAKENFASPTPVQAKGIPLALEGKDVLGRHPPSYHGISRG